MAFCPFLPLAMAMVKVVVLRLFFFFAFFTPTLVVAGLRFL